MQFSQLVEQQKTFLSKQLAGGLGELAHHCLTSLTDVNALNPLLLAYLEQCPYANLAYVVDAQGRQISANIERGTIIDKFYGQNLSNRPFFQAIDAEHAFYLSSTYISTTTLKPCMSAAQSIVDDGIIKGLLVLDFDLAQLSLAQPELAHEHWQQIKGDPAIRQNVFNQQRKQSDMDIDIQTVHNIATELLSELGIFHIKLHYGSSRATIWTYDNPYNYHIHVLEEIISPDICLLYAKQAYPTEAIVSVDKIGQIFNHFTQLRFMDENLYLRTGSLNIINGMIGLSFSCDGNHYLTVDDFLTNINKFKQ